MYCRRNCISWPIEMENSFLTKLVTLNCSWSLKQCITLLVSCLTGIHSLFYRIVWKEKYLNCMLIEVYCICVIVGINLILIKVR